MISKEWYKNHIIQIRKKAGPRYTPELNINLPISDIFNGLCRTEAFYTTIRQKYGELRKEFNYLSPKYENSEIQKQYGDVFRKIQNLFGAVEKLKTYNSKKIDWNKIQKHSQVIRKSLGKFSEELENYKSQVKDIKADPRPDGGYQASPLEQVNSTLNKIYKIRELIFYFENLSKSTKAYLSNHPFLLLTGSPGSGKTHLLCDLVESKLGNQPLQPAFLTFGEFYNNDKDFWTQALNQLNLPNLLKSKTAFLQHLNTIGKKSNCRSLLIIDALNENITKAPKFWKKNLTGIINSIKKYPNIALIISLRNGFETIIWKNQLTNFITEEHVGFRFKEWEAINKFFKSFKLPLPEIPLLMPEFQNPLFLLLFCKAFQKRSKKKDKQIFRGHEGATYIFEVYIDSISKPIEKEFKLKAVTSHGIWDTIIEKIAEEMVNLKDDRISEDKLEEIIKATYPSVESNKLIDSLEKNMLIVKVPHYEKDSKLNNYDIRFPFQKFSDHLIGRYVFKEYENEVGKSNKNLETAKRFFSDTEKFGNLLSDTRNRGIIEALSVQCPEHLKGTELMEVSPFWKNNSFLTQIYIEAFIESLIWRNPKAFSQDYKNTLKIINEVVIKSEHYHHSLLNSFLSVTAIPLHPFNAERLHQHLQKLTMASRDSWWSTFLHNEYGERRAVDRLIEWSWSGQDLSHISDDSIVLTSITLSWFLTTPNRFVRDKATIALVCLLENRLNLIVALLEKFSKVNDPYILERLFAVSYGCALRNHNDNKGLKILAEWIYNKIFKNNKPPVHILLRDYARGVIEVALRKGIQINVITSHVNPPYKSVWPNKIPSEKFLKKKYYPETSEERSKNRGFLDIWFSVLGSGDFDRYVIGTNSWSSEWSGRKLKNPVPSKAGLLDKFKKRLTTSQVELLEKAINPYYGMEISERITLQFYTVTNENSDREKNELEKKRTRQKAHRIFENTLTKPQKKYFKKEFKPYFDEFGRLTDSLDTFDLNLARRWIFNRTIQLGYDPKIHADFDNMVNRYDNSGRSEHKAERIGKKYQWIAYHEFMALVSDNFEFKGDSFGHTKKEFLGPWNPYMRDIDPSFTLQKDSKPSNIIDLTKWNEIYRSYNVNAKSKSNKLWLRSESDLPNPQKMIELTDDNNKEWLVLEGFVKWDEKTPPELDKFDIPRRELWYMLKSYIVKKKDAEIFFAWALKQNFMGRWMPEEHSWYEAFIGEFPNSLAFDNLRGNYNIWTTIERGPKDVETKLVVTSDSYLNEFTLDCSRDGGITINLPSKFLAEKMKLRHKNLDGMFYDANDNLTTIDTRILGENYPSALLIDKNRLSKFLNKNGLVIVWTLLGEKLMIGGSYAREDYLGRLEISGSYMLDKKGKLNGKFHGKFNK